MCYISLIIEKPLAETIFVTAAQCAATIIGIVGMFIIFRVEQWKGEKWRVEDRLNELNRHPETPGPIESTRIRLKELKDHHPFGKTRLLTFIIPNVATIVTAMICLLMLNGCADIVSAIPAFVVILLLSLSVLLTVYIIYDMAKSQ